MHIYTLTAAHTQNEGTMSSHDSRKFHTCHRRIPTPEVAGSWPRNETTTACIYLGLVMPIIRLSLKNARSMHSAIIARSSIFHGESKLTVLRSTLEQTPITEYKYSIGDTGCQSIFGHVYSTRLLL